jgi:flagellum-specific peptidoglycan hydrolase FlgJ
MAGIMQPQPNRTATINSPLLEQLREILSPTGGSPRTLEERLAAMSEAELQSIMQTAKFVQMAMQMKLAANDRTMGWVDLVQSMYGGMGIDRRSLLAEILEETNPLDFVPQPKQQREAQQDALGLYQRPEHQMPSQSEPTADDASASALEAVLAGAIPEPRSTPQRSTTYANKDEFLAALTPVAKEVAANLGISHKIVLAQAALESGWGSKVQGNNLMGIKSHGEKNSLDVVTHEIVNGKKVKITDSFRQYDSPEDSIRGYGAFLQANSMYKHFLRAGAENEDAQLSALQSSGYATDTKYAFKLRNIMDGLPDEDANT